MTRITRYSRASQRRAVHPTLGLKLRWYRKREGLSLRDLADRSGVQFSQISRFERGEETPNYRRACALADALEIPVSWIWDHGPPPEQTFQK